ncbi:MAG: glycosyltransferase family A protein, partial [Alphaproteobacteria bacterium]|nr:glycosyltransferase family A protein [Alphaproteobacteria bacterium]
MPPEISVVVPSFNRATLLPETLDAILAQSVPPLEVIVIDDGSTDGTTAMLAARYAGRVRVLRIENAGDLAARNAGLREARGRLVAWCDSDDVWQPGFLAAMAALWRAEPRACAAFADFTILRDGSLGTTRKFDTAPSGFWHGLRHLPEAGLGVFDAPVVARLIGFQPF